MKIGIFGGSFNPIHNGHIKVARYLVEHNLTDEAWILPCKKHALDKFLDREEDRVAMIKLAIGGIEKIKLSDFELKRDGKNYTYETLRGLKKEYSHDFSWIIGSDILKQIASWYGYEQLKNEAKFIVLGRQGYPIINPGINIETVAECTMENISSTKVRERVREGKSISDLVPKAVEDYILQNGLYRK